VPVGGRDLDLTTAARKFGAARFEALYRMWQQRDVQALWAMQGPTSETSSSTDLDGSNSPISLTSICS